MNFRSVAGGEIQVGIIIIPQVDLQGVLIEEGVAGQGKAGEHTIVEDPLDHICVFGIYICFLQFAGKHRQGNGGAGLVVIAVVTEHIGFAECLALNVGADTACDRHFLGQNVFEDILTDLQQLPVILSIGQHSHGGVQIAGPNGVTFGLLDIPNRNIRLRVKGQYTLGILIRVLSTLFKKEFRKIQILLNSGVIVQFDERQFDLL